MTTQPGQPGATAPPAPPVLPTQPAQLLTAGVAPLAYIPPIQFYDSADHVFPERAEYVALYHDGDYRYTGTETWPHERWITVLGGPAADAVGLADYEPGNRIYEQAGVLRAWAERRIAGHGEAIVYCDRAELHRAHIELGPVVAAHAGLLWWIPTLDDRTPAWTPATLAADIADNWRVVIPPAQIWANQISDAGEWDVSNLFRAWRP